MAKTDKKEVKVSKEQMIKALTVFADGSNVKNTTKDLGINRTYFYELIDKYELNQHYTRAREIHCDGLMDEIDRIMTGMESEEIHPATGRILIETLKWKLSKFYPKMFGDKSVLDVQSKGDKLGTSEYDKMSFEELYKLKYGKAPQ